MKTDIINVYGIPNTPKTKKQFHKDTYIEFLVPESLEKELCRIVEKRVKLFKKTCKCDYCKSKRLEAKKQK